MTVPSTSRRAGPYTGNGSAITFPFSFKVFSGADIKVLVFQGDTSTTLQLGSQYTVTLNANQDVLPGGYITTIDTPLSSDYELVIVGNLPYDQTTDLPTGGNFSAVVQENTFDRLVMQIQQLAERSSRQPVMPEKADISTIDIRLPEPEPDMLIAWNHDGMGFRNVSPDSVTSIAGFVTWKENFFNGGTSTFVLSESPGTIKNLVVVVDGIVLYPGLDYTLAGSTITTTLAAPAGTNNVYVRWGEALPYGTVDASDTTYKYGGSLVSVRRPVASKLDEWISPLDHGAVGDATTDDTAELAALFSDVDDNSVIDLGGRRFKVYEGVAGVSSGDALPLSGILRLSGKNNITIQNGEIFTANPSQSPTKLRFPSVISIDGCTNIKLLNVKLVARGQNWGDSDASLSLDPNPLVNYELRRPFLAQNGGHALVVIRSNGVCASDCEFFRAGSTGSLYVTSSDNVVLDNCYSSAESLGYAAFAADGWCGGAAQSGFPRHALYLNNCRTDKHGTDYGSKACVNGEDRDTFIYVYGGSFRDAYPNGAAHNLGNAFVSNGCHIYVHGADVDNCGSLGATTNNINDDTVLEMYGVTAKNIRTTMHIFNRTSFGSHYAKYFGCNVEISGTVTWSEVEYSVPTVVANRKISSSAFIEIINCITSGAHTFTLNELACYGGIYVQGGRHVVTDRIVDSAGWGGSLPGSQRGYEFVGGSRIYVSLPNTAVVSTAKTQATTAINAIKNQDSNGTFTYQLVEFARDVVIESNLMREFIAVANLGAAGLAERRRLVQRLVNCYQSANTTGDVYVARVRCTAIGAVSGGNINISFALYENKRIAGGTLVDDLFANRRIAGVSGGPIVSGSELTITVFVTGTTANLTVGTIYNVVVSD